MKRNSIVFRITLLTLLALSFAVVGFACETVAFKPVMSWDIRSGNGIETKTSSARCSAGNKETTYRWHRVKPSCSYYGYAWAYVHAGPGDYINAYARNNDGKPIRVVMLGCDASVAGCTPMDGYVRDSGWGSIEAVSWSPSETGWYSIGFMGTNSFGFCDLYDECSDLTLELIQVSQGDPDCSGSGGGGGGGGGVVTQ